MLYNIIMKKIIILFLTVLLCSTVHADSINPYAYKTIQQQAYQRQYRQMRQPRQIPYWQVQSNYTTRNRIYNNYGRYNSVQSNYNQYYYRGK